MTDIVERLRGDIPERVIEDHWTFDFDALDEQRKEAADEIERLRKVLYFAAGYISATSDHKTSHPEDVLKWIEHYALEGK